LHRAIATSFLTVSALAVSINPSKAEAPCIDAACVLNEAPACWGNLTHTQMEGLSPAGRQDLTFGSVICLDKDGQISTTALYGDEGLGDGGTYRVQGNKVEFTTGFGAEGWGAIFSKPQVTCEPSLSSTRQLVLNNCSDSRDERYELLSDEEAHWFLDNMTR
jgi:hypothetical protein